MKTSNAIKRELDRIAKAGGGVLQPAAVVEAARPKNSPLHSRFEWDDGAAADQYRLWQARKLIAITVCVIGKSQEEERVWISLKLDQTEAGGYRSMVSVLTAPELREELLKDALEDMEIFRVKYRHLKELADVFAAVDVVKKRKESAA